VTDLEVRELGATEGVLYPGTRVTHLGADDRHPLRTWVLDVRFKVTELRLERGI
jgi:hypothetical protein